MVKESKIFTTSDGKEYKSKKSAERHENELITTSNGLEKQDVDNWILKIAEINYIVRMLLNKKSDWRDWGSHHVKQLAKMILEMKDDIVTYKIIEEKRNGEEEVISTIKEKRIEDKKPPKNFLDKVMELSNNSTDGATYELVVHNESPYTIKYKIIKKQLSIEEKLKRELELSSSEIKDLVFDYNEVYQEEGEDRRWSKSMLTVVEIEGLGLYAVEWEKGLTEYQENEFYNQPKKVELCKKEVVTTITEVIYI